MYQEEYKRWLAADLQDADLNPELSKIEGNDEEIKDRFAVALKFGILTSARRWMLIINGDFQTDVIRAAGA